MSISRSRPEACAHSDHFSGFLSPLSISHRARLNIENNHNPTFTDFYWLYYRAFLTTVGDRLKSRILHIFGEMLHKSIFLLFVVQPVLKCLVVQLAMFESCSWGHFISTSPCNTWTIVVCSLSEEGIPNRQKLFQWNWWHFILRSKKQIKKLHLFLCPCVVSCVQLGLSQRV